MNTLIFVTMLFGAAFAATGLDKDAPIESQFQDVGLNGEFQSSWSGNGITSNEAGSAKAGPDNTLIQTIQGEVSYTAPDGSLIKTLYIADENGSRVEGAHLPVAPPAPELPPYIARALEWAKNHPYDEAAQLKKTYE